MLFNLASIAALLTIFPCILAAPIDEATRAPDFPRSLKSRSLSSRQGPMALYAPRKSHPFTHADDSIVLPVASLSATEMVIA